MAAVTLTLVLSFVLGSVTWLGAGSRLRISNDSQQNDMLNFLSYSLMALPLVFAAVFFLLESF